MHRALVTVGILLLLAGFVLMQQGSSVLGPVAEAIGLASRVQVDRTLIAPTLLTVPAQNYTFLLVDLQAGAVAKGSIEVVGAREISVYVMDEGNFTSWRHGQPSMVITAKPVTGSYNFTFDVKSVGTYYFVFDNQDTTRCTVLFRLSAVEHEVVLSPVVAFADYELLLLGVALTALGLRTERRRRLESKSDAGPTIEATAQCKFCGSQLQSGATFCEKCGRAQR